MEECLLVHPDNVEKCKRLLNVKVAVIARPDEFLQANSFRHLIVETEYGVHTRCYLASNGGVQFIVVYGRFGQVRTTSYDIDFMLTQRTLAFLGVRTIVGTFVVGSIKKEESAGQVYIPHDMVGLGGYNQSVNLTTGFRNADMLHPFCDTVRNQLIESIDALDFRVNPRGVYACFHHFPRIETAAELDYYESMGWDIVGQTLDPEATLARESGCHYAAIAVTIDDRKVRGEFLSSDSEARMNIDQNIIDGRRKTFDVFLASLPDLAAMEEDACNCRRQKTTIKEKRMLFYSRPEFLVVDR